MDVNNSSFPYGKDIAWYVPEESPTLPSQPLKSWLLSTSSLTQKLKNCCDVFEVKILSEGEIYSKTNESPDQKPLWVREVLLCLNGTPWVFASTLVPNNLMAVMDNSLKYLGNRPLGELLYSNDAFIPGKIEVTYFDCGPKLISLCQPSEEALWGRRRYFSYRHNSAPIGDIIVSEAFLPAAIKAIAKGA